MKLLTPIILILVLLTSCSETRTNDPIRSYVYWAGAKPTDDPEVLKGQYWRSGHWTKEYLVYLKIKPTNKWWEEFIRQNQLQIDNGHWNKPSDSPDWFQLKEGIETYRPADGFNDSRFFRDKATGECYIYEVQL